MKKNRKRDALSTTAASQPRPSEDDRRVVVRKLPAGKTEKQDFADAVREGIATNAAAVEQWSGWPYGQGNIDMTALLASLEEGAAAVRAGNRREALDAWH